MIRSSSTLVCLAAVLSLSSCGKAPAPETKPTPAPTETKKETATASPAAPAPAAPQSSEANMFPEAVDIGGFGSDAPVERADMPTRGILRFGPGDHEHSNGAHWETYTWTKFKAKRWGRYQVRLTYTLKRAALGMQFRMADLTVKKTLTTAYQPVKTYLGTVYVAQAGDLPFALLTPPTDDAGFSIQEIALIPTSEGSEILQPAEGGAITLKAGDATTWSETMRYEPKPEKNCLGYWSDPEDFAEWEFEVTRPGRYKVSVVHGCGGGNHGSEVEVKLGGQTLKFTTQDTGGYQNWKDIPVGEVEIPTAGKQRLIVDPANKLKGSVLDVHKVVLTPVS